MQLTLIDKEHLVDNIWAFRFQPDQPLDWIPGQFMQVELPHDHPDKEGTKRRFTVSSAPYEGFFQITTRVTQSAFKQALSKLAIGDKINLLEKPHGDFLWQDTAKPIVFVAGGIGVTPFRSILEQRHHEGKPLPVTLVYGGRSLESLPFRKDFDTWAKTDPTFNVIYEVSQPLTAKRIEMLVPNLHDSLVYVSGPEPMVDALSDQFKVAGLPEDQLKQDWFPNYTEKNY
jgi:ferredoxin-NADP reductase